MMRTETRATRAPRPPRARGATTLKHTLDDWREAQRLAHLGSWRWDLKTGATAGSDELLRIFGLDPATETLPPFREQKGRFYPPASWERLHAATREVLRTGVGYEFDVPALRNGQPIWVTARCEAMRDAVGNITGLRGTVQDITERKRVEEARWASEQRERERAAELAALLEAVPAPVFIAHDAACRHITGNRAADELLRNPRGAEASLGATDGTRPEHFRAFKEGRLLTIDELPAQTAARGEVVRDFEFDLVFADGSMRHVLANATPLRDPDGRPRGAVLVMLDMTERKRLQEALQARERQVRSFVRQAPVAMAMCDRSMNYVAASERWIAEYGRGRTEVEGLNLYALHPDLPERWRAVHAKALAGEDQFGDDDLWVLADGMRLWLRWSVRRWLDASGETGGIIIMAENITARKEAEEALRQSEERLRTVLHATRVGTFEVDLATGATHWNAVEFELLGLAPGSVSPSPEMFFRYVRDEDRAPLADAWAGAMRTGMLDAEFRVVRADGVERWLAGKGRFVGRKASSDTQGGAALEAGRFLGVNFDITERKRAEEALAEHRLRLAGIVGSAMDAIVSIDAAQRIVLFNVAAEKMFQCSAADAVGTPVGRLVATDARAGFAEALRQVGGGGMEDRTAPRALRGRRSNGEEFPFEASISRVDVPGDKLVTLILRDVSERKRLEQEVLEISAREQRRIGQDLHDDLCQWLTGTEMLCSGLAKALSGESPQNAARAVKIGESIRQALARARMLAHGLEPSVIRSEGLAGALAELAANAGQMFRIRCRYEGPAEVLVRDEVAALHLYRIAQEAVGNAARHGRARNVRIGVQAERERFAMVVSDDGCGVAPGALQKPGMGFRNMRYRAGIIGGTLEIRAGASGGTEIVCTFPKGEARGEGRREA